MPPSSPKRHHVIPRLLLRNFAEEPDDDRSQLWRLDMRSSAIHRIGRDNASVRKHYYSVEADSGGLDPLAEEILASIEDRAAPLVREIVRPGGRLRRRDRPPLAMFIDTLRRRTPQGRAILNKSDKDISELVMEVGLSNAEHFHEAVRVIAPDLPAELTEEVRTGLLARLNAREDVLEIPASREVAMMFVALEETAAHLADGLQWTILRTTESNPFALGDVGLAIIDNDPDVAHLGLSFATSPTTETTVPLSPTTCVALWPDPHGREDWPPNSIARTRCSERPATDSEVRSINLRSFAASDREIYANSFETLSHLCQAAKQDKDEVATYAPRGPKLWVGESRGGKTSWTSR